MINWVGTYYYYEKMLGTWGSHFFTSHYKHAIKVFPTFVVISFSSFTAIKVQCILDYFSTICIILDWCLLPSLGKHFVRMSAYYFQEEGGCELKEALALVICKVYKLVNIWGYICQHNQNTVCQTSIFNLTNHFPCMIKTI